MITASMHLALSGLADLPAGWEIIEVESLLSKDRGISVGVMYPGNHDPSGVPLIRAGDLSGNKINEHPAMRIAPEKHTEYSRTQLEGGELLISLVGEIGECAVVHRRLRGWNVARAVAVLRFRDADEAPFVRCCLLSKSLRHIMSAWANTTVQTTLNLKEIKRLPLPWPPRHERRRIAGIINALEDKLELNRGMSETLESMARALFKSWFVDFDPVRAKAEGRRPAGMDAETAALFPATFQESELGHIPTGWETAEIRQRAATIQYGFTQSSTTEPVGPRFLRITDIQGGRVDWNAVPFCVADEGKHARYRISVGDILVARTGASTGESIYIVEAPDAVFASYLVRIQFRDAGLARIVGEYMRTSDYFEYVAGAIGGSAQPNASAQVLAGATLVFPTPSVTRAFCDLVRPWDMLRGANTKQASTLAALRDTLLPKLLSGELRIRDAENMIEAHV